MEGKRKISINSIPLASSILIESYCDNIIITSKYNLTNFIFKSTLNQLLRVANMYFVIITIIILLQNYLTNWNNSIQGLILFSSFLVILIVLVANDLYSDYKRHQYDFYVNHKSTNLIDPITMNSLPIYWKDIKVGDLIKVHTNEDIPADIILLESSSKDNTIDLELNKKLIDLECNHEIKIKSIIHKQCLVYDKQCLKRISIEYIQPSSNINHFEGNLYLPNCLRIIPITVNNLIYRSSILRNTEWIIGVVVYTGIETKIALLNKLNDKSESGNTMDRLINISLIILFLSQVIASIITLTANELESMMYMTLLLVNIIVSIVFLTLEILKLKHDCNKYSLSKNVDPIITSEIFSTKYTNSNNKTNSNNNIIVNTNNHNRNCYEDKIVDSCNYKYNQNQDNDNSLNDYKSITMNINFEEEFKHIKY